HFQEGPGPAPACNRRLKEMSLVAASHEKALSRPLPDPRRFRDSWALMDEMQLRTEVAGYVAIQRVGDSLLKTDPGSLFALVGVGMLNLEPGGEGAKRSTELLRSAQQLYPLEPEVYHALSHLALLEKRYEDAAFLL